MKISWVYFQYYICFYTNEALSTIKNIKMLGNSTRSLFFFFFLNQQFITWHVEVDCGSYFITMYRRTTLHGGRENEKEEEKIK